MVPSPSITSNQCSIAILPRNISSQGFSEALSECLGHEELPSDIDSKYSVILSPGFPVFVWDDGGCEIFSRCGMDSIEAENFDLEDAASSETSTTP
jgi:hypothetical protein